VAEKVNASSSFRVKVAMRWRIAASLLSVVVGLSSVLSSFSADRSYWARALPFRLRWGSRTATAVLGFLLLVNASGLYRGRRVAWVLAVAFTSAVTLFHVLHGFHLEQSLVSLIFCITLIAVRRNFSVSGNPSSLARALITLSFTLAFNLFYAFLALYLVPRRGPSPDPRILLSQALSVIMFSAGPEVTAGVRHGDLLLNTVYAVNALSLLGSTVLLLQPVIAKRGQALGEREHAKAIAEKWGHSSLAFFTLWPDKQLYFNAEKTAYVSFKQVGNVVCVLGDPIGPPVDRVSLIAEFVAFCRDKGLEPVFYQVLPEHLPDYRREGLDTLRCGEEAIVDIQDLLSLRGNKWKSLRYTINKVERLGYSVRFFSPPLDEKLVDSLAEVSAMWLAAKGRSEKSFSLGWFDRDIIKDMEVAVAEDAHGRIVGFLNFVPMYNLEQFSPDLMRYVPGTPTGLVDFMLVEAARHYSQKGYSTLNLGLAPLAHITPEEHNSLTDKAIAILAENMPNLRGLLQFKGKYNPTWEPRYMAYPGALSLIGATLAVIRAGNPKGFLARVRVYGR